MNNENAASTLLSTKDRQAIDAAKLYYKNHYSQQQVADMLGISRPSVSKLLQHATEQGFVVITIHDPQDTFGQLAEELKEFYQLKSVGICSTPINHDPAQLRHALGSLGAKLLEKLVSNHDVVGVEWGRTIYAMSQHLTPQLRDGVEVVQLRGSETKASQGLNESETINQIAQSFNGKGQLLPLPIVFEDIKTKNLIQRETTIWRVLENIKKSRVVVFTVGAVDEDSLLFQSGFYTQDEVHYLQNRAVGSICAHFVDKNGRICLPDLNNRTVGIGLPELRQKEERVLIAGGQSKTLITHVALKHGYANRLITDKVTAMLLLDLIKQEKQNNTINT
ncbi:sugar-binding transcriptional regulator [Actinobacillus delphinicola]|uniref:DeoR family transcriptional regulator n=1 Tax=Actinobacillus delphinicola TaxID=51161 RepID=A0A448TSD3_9PAST|nr:sugar-binding transcriptional regulator [Actinobacillus delphinicola]VEJ08826.1 DeoR family transcriptional regulator [Actinobacillus delphinicola]